MLSRGSRWLTVLTAAAYFILGVPLFLSPVVLAPLFPWKVSPFVTMTIGGWCLGNAWLAWITARRWEWTRARSALLYLWLFGVFEVGVLVAFRDKLVLSHPVAWLYLTALGVNLLAAASGVSDLARQKPAPTRAEAGGLRPWHRIPIVAFIVFVGFLALYGLTAPLGAPGTNGGIFPETMSLFTLRSFAAFYLALALGVIPLVRERSLEAVMHHSLASYGLVVAITVAALVNLGLFDFAARPGGLVYFGAYLAVGIPLPFAFRTYGTGSLASQGRRDEGKERERRGGER